MKITGKIVRGVGESASFLSIPWVNHQMGEKLHFQPYNGTLNILVDDVGIQRALKSRQGDRLVSEKAFQDYYPDALSHCYGCGRLNEHGLQLKSYWDGEETVAVFHPQPYHMAIPGYVYGGLLASIIDCHGTGTAAAAAYRAEQRAMDTQPPFVT